MIGAERTGTTAGLRVGEKITPTDRFPVERLAHITYEELRKDGIAHIEPEDEFCRWFAYGMKLAAKMHGVYANRSMSPVM